MDLKNIAILGATSHIAKGLIYSFMNNADVKLSLYARNIQKTRDFLELNNFDTNAYVYDIKEFGNNGFDVVINCIGYGDPGKLKNAPIDFVKVTEQYDNLIIKYIEKNSDCMYLNLSSGAAYGDIFNHPAIEDSKATFGCNPIKLTSLYGIAKLYSEAKHRAMSNYRIVDLRIFGYFSRFIDLDSGYFMADLINCVKSKVILKTSSSNFIRDFIHPSDLYQIVLKIITAGFVNKSFDICSKMPVSKFEILECFKNKMDLMYQIVDEEFGVNATGSKSFYYSTNNNLKEIGFIPEFSSIESLILEAETLC